MTGWLQPGGYVIHFKKGQSGYHPITLLSHDWDIKLYPFMQVFVFICLVQCVNIEPVPGGSEASRGLYNVPHLPQVLVCF